MYADVCGLTTVREQKTRIGIAQPTKLDSMATESTNVGKEGLNSRKSKKNTAEAPPTMILIAYQIFKSVVRVESLQYRVIVPAWSASIAYKGL